MSSDQVEPSGESNVSGRDAKLARIAIVGGGYAGAYCAAALETALRRRIRPPGGRRGNVEVVLIDPRNYMTIFPFLIEAGTGGLEPRHTVVSIRSFLKRTVFRMARVTAIDFSERTVRFVVSGENDEEPREAPHRVLYDHLVLCPGSITLKPAIPGLREHARTVKSLADAVALRDRAIRLMEQAEASDDPAERARLLHMVIIGASFTGAELAGEFHEFLQRLSKKYPNVRPEDCRITLLELAPRILSALSEELAQFATRKMRARGIDIRTEETVSSIAGDHVILQNSGERLDAATVVWCAGIAPAPLVENLDLPKDERGYILCERDCRVEGFDNVWAIGDSAVNIDAEGRAYPATAQHAVREGKHVGRQLARVLAGKPAEPFNHRSQGSLAALGCRTGVAEVFGLKISGFWAWWLWRTVYLLKMPGIARKLRVAIDWTLDLFFTRDDVQLGVHRREAAGP